MLINGTYNAKTLNQWVEFLLKEINLAQSGVMNHARFQASQKIKEALHLLIKVSYCHHDLQA
jgi:hypothetical protein